MTYNDILLKICHEISIQIPHRYLSPEELNRNALLKDDISLYILRADYWSSCYSEYVKTYQKFVSSYDHTISKSNSSFFRHETFNKGLGFSNFVKWHFSSTDRQNYRRTPIHLNTITKHLISTSNLISKFHVPLFICICGNFHHPVFVQTLLIVYFGIVLVFRHPRSQAKEPVLSRGKRREEPGNEVGFSGLSSN